MAAWKPALTPGVDLRTLPLTPQEGFIASRLDGATDLHGIAMVTGLPAESVGAALEKLISHGAVSRPDDSQGAVSRPGDEPPPRQQQPDEPEAPVSAAAGIHRKLYETTLRGRTPEERTALAKTAHDPELSALCFDAVPTVVNALLENQRFGLVQARLVAAHHRTGSGLLALCSRAPFAADVGVRRALLRNPLLPAGLLRRLYGGRRLLEQYKLCSSRDLPEQTKGSARDLLRSRFMSADADERVEAIVKTEGRCLALLAGLPVDAKTTALLCGRGYTSTLFVQNLARWSVAPGPLIAHLLKQEVVRRSPPLRTWLLRHANAPAAEKQR
jgi:hypothetical protein